MNNEEKAAWISLFCMVFIFLSLVFIVNSFEIITFSLATQEMFSSDFNCELEFNEVSDMNYGGHWNCKPLQGKPKRGDN